MSDASFFTAQQASDPGTPLAVLGDIARDRPDLRPLVAANPAAYPELLDWLGGLGDPQVDAALAARGAGAALPPPSPPEPIQQPQPESSPPTEPSAEAGTWLPDGGQQEPPEFPGAAPEAQPGALPPPGGYAGTTDFGQSTPYPGAAAEQPPAAPGYPGSAPGYAGAAAAGGFAGAAGPPPAGPGAPPYGASPYGAPPYGSPPAGGTSKKGMSPVVIALLVAVPVLLIGGAAFFFIVLAGSAAVGTYGSDPELDALYDQCQAGDMASCDELYREAPLDSEYEEFGDTCGNRQGADTNQWCEPSGGTGSDASTPQSYGDDPALDALYDDCRDGDMGACDRLYFDSPVGSEYEEFGDTCGNRQTAGSYCDSDQ